MHWYDGYHFFKCGCFSIIKYAYDMFPMLVPVSYKITIPAIFTGKLASIQLHIWICILLAGSCKEGSSSCKYCKSVCSYSVSNTPSEKVSLTRFPILAPAEASTSSCITFTTSLPSRTSMLATVDVSFYIPVTDFTELLGVVLGMNQTVR